MVARVGINGFGRIGRVIFRTCMQSKGLEVTAINDPAIAIEYICYLIKFDSTHGKFKSAVTYSDDEIFIEDKKIKVFREKLPPNIPWQTANVQYVVEASGMFTNLEKASGHLASVTVRRVIITAPTVDVPMLILGVNKEQINAEHKVISCASSTLYCLAPIVKILEDNYGIAEGSITSIHAMTPSLKPLDGLCIKGKHWRDHRSIHQNIIPAATGACKALGKIIPSMKDKLTGLAFRVPIVNVSVLDMTVRLSKNTTIQDIIKCVEMASQSTMKGIIKTSKDQEVSSDFLGEEHSCILDGNSSLQLNPKFFKLICWYENEYSYACRVVGSIKYSEENQYKSELMTKNPIYFDHVTSSNQSVSRKPIDCSKREYVISNSQTQKSSNTIFKPSKETGFQARSGSSQLALCETKQSNEIFKVWNDEVQILKPLVRENRNTFFQSCMTLRPSYFHSKNYTKNKKCLEEVQKEFTKMADMTEDLLKKSNQSSREKNILGEEIENEVVKNEVETKKESKNTQLTLSNVSKTKNSEVFQTNISNIYKHVFKTHNKNVSNILKPESTNKLSDTTKVESKQLNQEIGTKCNVKTPDNSLVQRLSNSQDNKIVNSTKANGGNVNQNHLKLENTIGKPNKSLCATTVGINIKPDSFGYKADLGKLNVCKKLSEYDIKHAKLNKLDNAKNNSDVGLINSTKYDFRKPDKSDLNISELPVTCSKTESSEHEDKELTMKNERRKEIIEEVLKILNTDSMDDKTSSPSLVNTNTTISTREVNKRLDIYDKIDSESGTDSENSFQINERTSQVIDITDLTGSLEDLARLDKICRIIEISDEMSDKLFSALDNNQNRKQKKWSFNDLCERLKLDEFCNNVFGQSQS